MTNLVSLPNVLDVPVLPIADILKVKVEDKEDFAVLQHLKNPEQLKRLETITGQLVSSFIKSDCIQNYFEYRHVFRYLIQTGQEIPQRN